MKKILPFVILVTIVLNACKKGDSGSTTTTDLSANAPSLIIGTWKEGATTSIYYYNGTEVYRETTPSTNKYVYRADGTMDIYILNINQNTYVLASTDKYYFSNSNKTLVITGMVNYGISFTDANTYVSTYTSTSTNNYMINGKTYNSYTAAITTTKIQ